MAQPVVTRLGGGLELLETLGEHVLVGSGLNNPLTLSSGGSDLGG